MNAGDRIIFDTHGIDTDLNHLTGSHGIINRSLRQSTPLLPDSEADSVEEVGQMFQITLDGGRIIDAFEDELTLE